MEGVERQYSRDSDKGVWDNQGKTTGKKNEMVERGGGKCDAKEHAV